jgi:DNA-binding CsgD family transcriptional regulator
MLNFVSLKPVKIEDSQLTPDLLEPLVRGSRSGEDLAPLVKKIVNQLGFDSFLCGFSMMPKPNRDCQLYVFTTLPREWTQLYDERSYVEVDPRIELVYDRATMLLWSGDDFAGRSQRLDEFIREAARFGVRSGACFSLHDVSHNGVLVAFNSARRRLDRIAVQANVGNLYAFGAYFHQLFMHSVIEKQLPSRLRGAALTNREVAVLKQVAHGLTVEDIGYQLGITPRTVRYHLDAARTKMGAINRDEAIALAVKGGLFEVLP